MSKIDLEKLFLSALGQKEKLQWYLQHNVDLVKYIEVQWPKYLALADIALAFISREKRREMVGELSLDRILRILKIERSDLYSVLIKYPNGISWIKKNIENFRERFL